MTLLSPSSVANVTVTASLSWNTTVKHNHNAQANSDVNKDLTFKAKDQDKDQTLKAKDQDKD